MEVRRKEKDGLGFKGVHRGTVHPSMTSNSARVGTAAVRFRKVCNICSRRPGECSVLPHDIGWRNGDRAEAGRGFGGKYYNE